MKREKLDFYSKLVICILGAVVFGYIFMKHVLILILPFLFAWFAAFAVRSPARRLHKLIRISERVLRLALAVLSLVSVLALLSLGIWRLLLQGWRILNAMSEKSEMTELIERLLNPESLLSRFLPMGVAESISRGIDAALEELASVFADLAAGFVAGVPQMFLFLIITLIATVYFALDLERINEFIKARLPERIFLWLVRFKDGFFSVGVRYIRAYLTIMLLVFSITLAGLILLGVEYAFLIAVVAAVLDILPAIGIGTVLVPWGVFEVFLGSRPLGIGLIVLFLIVAFVRQLLEPRIVGKNLGLHPVVSLVLLWSAYSLFGILGIISVPVAVVVINALFNKNDPSKVKKLAPEEADGA